MNITRFISRTFLKGLIVVLPAAASVYILTWLFSDLERFIHELLVYVIPEPWYIPGMGVLAAVGGVFTLGLLMYPLITRKLIDSFDNLFRNIPVVSMIYNPMRDFMNMFGGDMAKKLDRVVMVQLPHTDFEMLGFVTREDNTGLPEGLMKDDHIVVLIPWSTQIGGLCFVLPKSATRPVDMTVEEGLRWALTAGVSAPAESQDERERREHAAEAVQGEKAAQK